MTTIEQERAWSLPVYAQLDIEPVGGEGPYLHTADGRRILDFYGGHAVAALGYGHPRLVEAIAGQAQRLSFQSNLLPLSLRARACEALARFAPPGLDRVFLVNSGAEANENALKIAFSATGRSRVVALEGAFHGRTAAAAAVTWGSEHWYGFPRKPFDVTFVPRERPEALVEAVDRDTAAVILEVIQGEGGVHPARPAYLRFARDLCTARGALLILDEVQTGFGRTGRLFACEHSGVVPDIMALAKSIGGGLYPNAAVLYADRPPLTEFVELPADSPHKGLCYSQPICGAIKGALEMVPSDMC